MRVHRAAPDPHLGVHSVRTKVLHSFREMVNTAATVAKHEEFAQPGGKLVITAGVPFGTPGTTNYSTNFQGGIG